MTLNAALLLTLLSVCQIAPSEGTVEDRKMGGWNRLDPQSQQVQDVMKKVVQQYNMEVNSPNYFKLVYVTSAWVQVTNALNYRITATIGETKCSKSEDVDLEKCEIGDKRIHCNFKVTYNLNSVEPKVMSSCG